MENFDLDVISVPCKEKKQPHPADLSSGEKQEGEIDNKQQN